MTWTGRSARSTSQAMTAARERKRGPRNDRRPSWRDNRPEHDSQEISPKGVHGNTGCWCQATKCYTCSSGQNSYCGYWKCCDCACGTTHCTCQGFHYTCQGCQTASPDCVPC